MQRNTAEFLCMGDIDLKNMGKWFWCKGCQWIQYITLYLLLLDLGECHNLNRGTMYYRWYLDNVILSYFHTMLKDGYSAYKKKGNTPGKVPAFRSSFNHYDVVSAKPIKLVW